MYGTSAVISGFLGHWYGSQHQMHHVVVLFSVLSLEVNIRFVVLYLVHELLKARGGTLTVVTETSLYLSSWCVRPGDTCKSVYDVNCGQNVGHWIACCDDQWAIFRPSKLIDLSPQDFSNDTLYIISSAVVLKKIMFDKRYQQAEISMGFTVVTYMVRWSLAVCPCPEVV